MQLNPALHLNTKIGTPEIEKNSLRQGFGEALRDLGNSLKDIVVLTADLKDSTKADLFANKFPERFIEIGIAEQNMAGISAGLALAGKIPFMTSYTEFSPGRNWEQIKLSICYTNANVKICSTHAGFSSNFDGAQHQNLEDLAMLRTLPNLTIIAPADYNQAKKAVETAVKVNGPVFIRLQKNDSEVFTTEKTNFEFGKAQIIKEGSDITLIGTGTIMYSLILAAEELEKHDIHAEIINVPFIKPFDSETIVESVKKTKKALSIEEHQIAGGLGSLVAETLTEHFPTPLIRMGVKDTFGESGRYEELLKKHKLTVDDIVKIVKNYKLPDESE